MKDYRILLYYEYVTIENPEQFREDHKAFCEELGIKGRIYVSDEGLNGTLSGTVQATQKYMDALHKDPRFENMDFKIDEADGHAFKKLKVKYRPEIVSLHLGRKNDEFEDVDPTKVTGRHLEPEEFREALLDEDTIILDARNDYEYDLGHFRGAVRPDIDAFWQLPNWIQENKEKFMDKKVVTYCNGGVRCEKLTGWMLKEGIEAAQLKNGIHNYSTHPETQGDLWDGVLYVFDDRLTMEINHIEHHVVGKDHWDGSPSERAINCANPFCNKRILGNEETEAAYVRGCSPECRAHERNRYVKENNISKEEWQNRLKAIGENLPEFA